MLAYVTTSERVRPPLRERAERVAARCGVEHRPGGPRRPGRGEGVAYVVGNHRDELRGGGASLAVHAGMLAARLERGRMHPLVRAVAPEPVGSVWDATCGLGADALHLATVLDARVLASEASPAIYSLLEEGLKRLARERRTSAAGRMALRFGRAQQLLAASPGSVDVVCLDPMFPAPARAAPGFELLREVACAGPVDSELVEAAGRAARQRVVLKLPRDAEPPVGFDRRVDGRAVSYAACELSAPR